jgi:hypothetical protein
MLFTLAEESVGDWSPGIFVSRHVSDSPRIAEFIQRARCGYVAPAIIFQKNEAVTIAGRHFATLVRDHGLIENSIHTLGRHEWHQLFFGIGRSSLYPKNGTAPLVIGNAGHGSYYHWTLESIGAVLIHRLLQTEMRPLVVPPLRERWQIDLIDIFDVNEPLIEVGSDELAAFDEAVLTNLSGRAYSFAPHPVVLRELTEYGGSLADANVPKRIYISRFDVPTRRRMENESELCAFLRSCGFKIVSLSDLSVAEQAALFRGAELIVAPHGAGLTNLVYAGNGADGPKIVELIQESYLARGFLKIAQAKHLDYRAIVNPDVMPADYHHDGTWRCDIDLLKDILETL